MTLFERTRDLVVGIDQARQTLRDEHYPYDGGLRVYEALHEALRHMGSQAHAFLRWAEMFPGQELNESHQTHLRTLELTLKSIKETLG